jgi:ATP-binding cassette subfamily G (WHITE) protein 2 (PDR)
MLEIIGAGASGKAAQDWPSVWRDSSEAGGIQTEIERIHQERSSAAGDAGGTDVSRQQSEFAMPFTHQLWYVTRRVFQQYWREPQYVYAKLILGIASALFIGFSFFKPNSSIQGFQDVLFSTFMITSIFSTLVQQ